MNKSDLRRIIKEEITKILNEEPRDMLRDLRAAGVNPNNKSQVEKYLGRELSDSEYNEMLGRSDDDGITIMGRKNGRPIYYDRRTKRSWLGEMDGLYENEETTTIKMGSKEIVMKPGTEITPEMEQLIRRYDHNYRYIDDYTQMKDAEAKNNKIMDELRPLGIIKIW
jgi:hypothetical protein